MLSCITIYSLFLPCKPTRLTWGKGANFKLIDYKTTSTSSSRQQKADDVHSKRMTRHKNEENKFLQLHTR